MTARRHGLSGTEVSVWHPGEGKKRQCWSQPPGVRPHKLSGTSPTTWECSDILNTAISMHNVKSTNVKVRLLSARVRTDLPPWSQDNGPTVNYRPFLLKEWAELRIEIHHPENPPTSKTASRKRRATTEIKSPVPLRDHSLWQSECQRNQGAQLEQWHRATLRRAGVTWVQSKQKGWSRKVCWMNDEVQYCGSYKT